LSIWSHSSITQPASTEKPDLADADLQDKHQDKQEPILGSVKPNEKNQSEPRTCSQKNEDALRETQQKTEQNPSTSQTRFEARNEISLVDQEIPERDTRTRQRNRRRMILGMGLRTRRAGTQHLDKRKSGALHSKI
jgi:predicted metal-dependent hydrolase